MTITGKLETLIIGMGVWIGACTMELAGRIKRNERGDVPGWVMITFMIRT